MAMCDAQHNTRLHLERMHQAAIPDGYGHGYKILPVGIDMGEIGRASCRERVSSPV